MRSVKPLLALIFLFTVSARFATAQHTSGYKLIKTFHIASGGGWDYIAVNDHQVYVSHASQVNILDQQTGDSIGYIPNTTGVHGIAFIPYLGKGYTSNGRLNNITVFDLKTHAVLKQIAVGQNPDAIMYDPYSKKIITCNGRSNDLSIVDPVNESVVATIPLSGKPETAVSDEAGRIFVNIEDKNSISVIDMKSNKILNTWSIAPGDSPTGLAIDLKTKRLFAGCEKLLVIVNATTGKTENKLAIGEGCDGVVFDPATQFIFASCGEGTMAIAKENEAGDCRIIDTVLTKRSARTITIDPLTHQVFLPAAELGKATPGQRPPVIPGTFQILVYAP